MNKLLIIPILFILISGNAIYVQIFVDEDILIHYFVPVVLLLVVGFYGVFKPKELNRVFS